MKLTKSEIKKLIREQLLLLLEKAKPVNYKDAYKRYHSSPKAKKQRAMRNRIGRKIKKMGIQVPDGHEIDHIKALDDGGTNDLDNIRFVPRGYNRRRGQKITTRKRKRNGTYKSKK
jgi:hypothetical protein